MHYIGVTDTPLTDGAKKEDFPTLVPHSEGSLTKTTGFVSGECHLKKCSYFSHLYKFTRSVTGELLGIDNTPTEEQIDNMKALCEKVLEPLRY